MKNFIFLMIVPILLCFTVKSSPMDAVTSIDKVKYQVGYCESRNKHDNIWGDNGKAYGKFQFHEKTFNYLKVKYGVPGLQWKSEKDQEELFKRAIEDGQGKLWTCYREMKKKKVTRKTVKANKYTGVGSIHKIRANTLATVYPVKTELLTISMFYPVNIEVPMIKI